MNLIPGICSQCGATLSVDKSKEAMICPYCNTPFVVEKAIQMFNMSYNITNNINAQNVIIEGKDNYDFNIVGGVLKKYNGTSISVVIPGEVIKIGGDSFADTLITEVRMSNNVREIGYGAFRNCKYLEKITLSENLLLIENSVFKGCKRLKEITLPSMLEEIGSEVFVDCDQLEKVYLSSKLLKSNKSAEFAFGRRTDDGYAVGCIKLENIYIDGILLEDDELYFQHFPFTMRGREIALHMQREEWKMRGLCQYCGGTFEGFFSLHCRRCGKNKDY